jgi:hypothetical protein
MVLGAYELATNQDAKNWVSNALDTVKGWFSGGSSSAAPPPPRPVFDASTITGIVGRAAGQALLATNLPTSVTVGFIRNVATAADPAASTGSRVFHGVMGAASFLPALGEAGAFGTVAGGAEEVAAGADAAATAGEGVAALPEYVYHYTTEATADLIQSGEYLGLEGRTLYLTPNGELSPVQAGIELALPQTNTAGALFRVDTSALDPASINIVRQVTGNVLGRGGGGTEILYEGRVLLEAVTRLR